MYNCIYGVYGGMSSMPKRMKRTLAMLAVLALCLSLCACGSPAPEYEPAEQQPIDLWCTRDDALCSCIEELAGRFNSEHPGLGFFIRVKVFEDERQLGEEMDSSRPELLLCSLERAAALNGRGGLGKAVFAGEAPRFAGFVSGDALLVGVSFFPLGAEVPVLVRGRGLPEPNGIHDIINSAAAFEGHFFGADDYARMFGSLLLCCGEELSVDSDNLLSPHYVELYNAMAELMFDGKLDANGEGLADKVAAGDIAFAAVGSSVLAGKELSSVELSALPPLEGEKSFLAAEVFGLACTNQDEELAAFIGDALSWFCAEANSAVPAAGLVPAGEEVPSCEGELEALMCALPSSCELTDIASLKKYISAREDFNKRFAEAMALLSGEG